MERLVRIILNLSLLAFFALFLSCGNNQVEKIEKEIDPDDLLPGRVVTEMNSDSTPKVVLFYDLDEKGMPTEKVNHEIHYYPGKKKYIEGDVKNNLRNGDWKSYFENGNVQSEVNFVNGKENGKYAVYYENGKLFIEGHFDMGNCIGEWSFYGENGDLNQTLIADDKTVICGSCPRCKEVRVSEK